MLRCIFADILSPTFPITFSWPLFIGHHVLAFPEYFDTTNGPHPMIYSHYAPRHERSFITAWRERCHRRWNALRSVAMAAFRRPLRATRQSFRLARRPPHRTQHGRQASDSLFENIYMTSHVTTIMPLTASAMVLFDTTNLPILVVPISHSMQKCQDALPQHGKYAAHLHGSIALPGHLAVLRLRMAHSGGLWEDARYAYVNNIMVAVVSRTTWRFAVLMA